ncbi:MAG: alanine--tRNA ligase [Acidobacteriota bacterium]
MKSQDVRQSFLDYFARHAHKVMPSAPLVPHGDPTLLFTNAGMVPFKDFFLGLETPPAPRAVSVQKCLRVSGKHNDLENVGPSPRHHTFFEMLGNFSFGDYFKEDAIRFGWELVTEGYGLDPDRLYATVFEEDDEAYALWQELSTLPDDRILRCGADDNFWAMGPTGPCGPCSEIFVDRHPELPAVGWEEGNDSSRYLEIWNLVFMQFDRNEAGELNPLPDPSIDTGAGVERISAVLQGVESNYDTDLFQPILKAAAAAAGTTYGADPDADTSLRVIADHLRATAFLLADGVIPGPDGRGYVLRRLLRRAVRHGMRLGFEEPFLHSLVPVLDVAMGGHYEELRTTADATSATIQEEEEKYLDTRAAGARHIQIAIDKARTAGQDELDGDVLFDLYETHGQDLDAVREIAEEEQLGLDEVGFRAAFDRSRERSQAVTSEHQKRMASLRTAIHAGGELGETEFVGYEHTTLEGVEVLRLARLDADGNAHPTTVLEARESGVAVLATTPFYAESGGQIGDVGTLRAEGLEARVSDTQKDASGTIFHSLEVVTGTLRTGASIDPTVDTERRDATERNHTATHLLHAALRAELGTSVRQAGSLVAPDRLRFDFTHNRPLEPAELRRIEDRVNGGIRAAMDTTIEWQDREAAMASGAMALFGEKYGDRVRTVRLDEVSTELCGGCHVANSGAIGLFLVTSERGVASGVRRIEAVTGEGALDRVRERESLLDQAAHGLGTSPERLATTAVALQDKVKGLERELAQVRMQLVAGSGADDADEHDIDGVKVVAREVPAAPAAELRKIADKLRDKLGSGVVILVTRDEGKVAIITTVSKDLTKTVKAGDVARALSAIVGGKGGGRPDFAQAGGREPDKVPALLEAIPEVVRDAMT